MTRQQRLPFTRNQAVARDLVGAALDAVPAAPNPAIDDVVEEIERPASAPPNASQLRRKRRAPTTSHNKPRSSWVYNHMPDADKETRYFSKDGLLECYCKYCP